MITTTSSIDEQIQSFYAEQALSAASLARLRGVVQQKTAQERATADATKSERENLRMWQTVALAATIAVAFLAGALFIVRRPMPSRAGGPVAEDVSQKIVQEVAMRHGRCTHEIVFTAPDFASLVSQMKRLDFQPVLPGKRLGTLKLVGAHYCKVDGQIALHAVFVDEHGKVVSLFETRSASDLGTLQQAKHVLDGTEVEMWQTNGVLLALAKKA